MQINEFAALVHKNAWDKGFHSKEETDDQFIERACNNLHDEVSELHTAWRQGDLWAPCDKAEKMKAAGIVPLRCAEEEYADIVIRALDNMLRLGIDIESALQRKHAYNTTREFRHGNKKS